MGQFQSIERRGDLPVRVGNDTKAAGIYGCVVLSTGNVLFTDYFNRKVKVVNVEMGEVISSLSFFSGPSDVTSIAFTRAAVTLPEENKIQLFHVTQRDTAMSIDYSIRVNGRCIGIDFDYRLIVSFLDPPKVELINLDGIVLRTIKHDSRGMFLFDSPTSVFLSRDRVHFYCSDVGRHQVLKIRIADGEVDAVNTEISQPLSLIELPDDNLLVVSSDPVRNSVHHLSPDLRAQKAVLASGDGLRQPRALCLRQKGNKLFDVIISNNKGMSLTDFRMAFK